MFTMRSPGEWWVNFRGNFVGFRSARFHDRSSEIHPYAVLVSFHVATWDLGDNHHLVASSSLG